MKLNLADAANKDALYTELDSFKKLVRYIAKHCMTDEQKELFTQGESSMKHRQTTIGITGHVPAIQGNLILTEKKAATVSKSMFKIRNGTPKKATTAYSSMCEEIEKMGTMTTHEIKDRPVKKSIRNHMEHRKKRGGQWRMLKVMRPHPVVPPRVKGGGHGPCISVVSRGSILRR